MTNNETAPAIGHIVTPQGDPTETIIGIVTRRSAFNPDLVDVVWISDKRGAFTAWESVNDIDVADCSGRPEMADFRINHTWLAMTLRDPMGSRR